MENIIEKVVTKKIQKKDKIIKVIAVIICIVICSIPIIITSLIPYSPVVLLIAIYITYRVVVSRNIEYEYEFVGDSISISKIFNKSYRKKIFSSALTDFDIIAPKESKHYLEFGTNVQNNIEAISSYEMNNIYFGIIQYKEKRTSVLFESDDRILKHIKKYLDYKLKEKMEMFNEK